MSDNRNLHVKQTTYAFAFPVLAFASAVRITPKGNFRPVWTFCLFFRTRARTALAWISCVLAVSLLVFDDRVGWLMSNGGVQVRWFSSGNYFGQSLTGQETE